MRPQFRFVSIAVMLLVFSVVFANAQSDEGRKIGPETAKSIQEAKLDPAFQTTKLERVALLPIANTSQHKEAAGIISKNTSVRLFFGGTQ